jgi:hypothetical protein
MGATIVKFVATLFAAAIALTPFWIFLLLWSGLNPKGFWEKLATSVFGYILLGGGQVFLLAAFVALCWLLWAILPRKKALLNKMKP